MTDQLLYLPLLPTDTPETLLLDDKRGEYYRSMQIFHNRLVELHLNIYILEKLVTFPLHLFLGPDLFFFRQVLLNCFHASVLIVTSLTTDRGDGVYTLLMLRDRLSTVLLKPEYRTAFRKNLQAIHFPQRIRSLQERARQLRNQEIAHLLVREAITSDGEIERQPFSLQDLQTLRDALGELFRALSFNATYLMFPIGYSDDPMVNGGLPTDIERLLTMIANQSELIHLPETNPTGWQERTRRLSREQLMIINHYRNKLQLPEV